MRLRLLLPLLLLTTLCAAPLPAQTPRDADPAARRLLAESNRLAEAGDTEGALRELGLLVERFGDDRMAPTAWARIARLRHERGEIAAATIAIDRLAERFPRSAQNAESQVLGAEIRLAQATSPRDLASIRAELRRIPVLFGASKATGRARVAARVLSAEIALLLDDPAGAAADLIPALEDEEPGPWSDRGRGLLVRAWLLQGESSAALEAAARLVGRDDADPQIRAATEDLLDAYRRAVLRPALDEPTWRGVSRFPVSGTPLREPVGVAVDDQGRVLIVDGRERVALLLDAAGSEVRRASIADEGRPTWSDDGTRDGVFHIAEARGLSAPFGGFSPPLTDPRPGKGALKNVLAAAPGRLGDWWIAAKGRDPLRIQTREGWELLTERRLEPIDVATDFQGRAYVLDDRNLQVLRLGLEGEALSIAARGDWKRPQAVAVDSLGFVYVLDRGQRRIDVFDRNGDRRESLGPILGGGVELRQPQDLAVDRRGRLFIADARLPFVVVLD